jgi:hypothetical protein
MFLLSGSPKTPSRGVGFDYDSGFVKKQFPEFLNFVFYLYLQPDPGPNSAGRAWVFDGEIRGWIGGKLALVPAARARNVPSI